MGSCKIISFIYFFLLGGGCLGFEFRVKKSDPKPKTQTHYKVRIANSNIT